MRPSYEPAIGPMAPDMVAPLYGGKDTTPQLPTEQQDTQACRVTLQGTSTRVVT